MASSACDPLQVPEGFWQRDDVGNALDHRDIGALFRLLSTHAGASQTGSGPRRASRRAASALS
jgi:hypothetical protein